MQKLFLNFNRIDDSALAQIGMLSSLRYLDMLETQVGDQGLRHLGKLSDLESLNLCGNKITGKGVAGIAGLRQLCDLDLSENEINDAALDPPLYTNQDTLPRPDGESSMKEFRALDLGTIKLDAGRGPLTLRALEIPGREVMHVRAVTLTLLP